MCYLIRKAYPSSEQQKIKNINKEKLNMIHEAVWLQELQ